MMTEKIPINLAIALLSGVLAAACTKKPIPPARDNFTRVANKMHSSFNKHFLADTVQLHISNGSLAPEYQYFREWVLTEKNAVYRETIGENPEIVSHKKMNPQLWEKVRNFNANAAIDSMKNQLDGAEEVLLIYHLEGKKYRFPVDGMENKVIAIERFFNPSE